MGAGAFGAAIQTALGSAATVTAPLEGIRAYTDAPQYGNQIPSYKTNSGNTETAIFITTREGRVHVEGDVSNVNILALLASAASAAVSGTYKTGGVQKFLSARWNEPDDLIIQHWLGQDFLVNEMSFEYSLDNPLRFTADLFGPVQSVVTSAWTTAVTPSTLQVPFAPWEVVISKDGVAACVRRMKITINNNLEPIYCSPAVAPDETTPAGLAPTKYNRNPERGCQVRVDAEYSYTGDAGSSYEAFRKQTIEPNWVIAAADPTGAASVTFTMARVGYTQGEIVREAQVRQHLQGAALYDATAATALAIAVV